MTLPQLYIVLLIGCVTVLASIAAIRATHRLGLPALLVFLGAGIVLGEDGLGIPFGDFELAQVVGTSALALILIEGGLTTRWRAIRGQLAPAGILATAGVGISVAVVASGAHYLLGFSWQTSLILGAVVASTDAAAVFSELRGAGLPKRLSGTLEAESGFNDAPAVILVLAFSSAAGVPSTANLIGTLAWQLTAGTAIGLAVGFGGAWLLRRLALPVSGLYPLAVFSLGLAGFALAGALNASGFIAAYLAALILGNSRLPHRAATQSFATGLGWMAQLGMFVMLGLLASPGNLLDSVIPALILGSVLTLVARPLSVLLCLTPFRFSVREQTLIAWAGLRGAVPIVLATIPRSESLPGGQALWDIVFILVVVFTLLQGPTLPWVAKRLGLSQQGLVQEVDIETAPLDAVDGEVLTITVPKQSGLAGIRIFELRLPEGSAIAGIVRGDHLFVPANHDRLRSNDQLIVLTTPRLREATEQRLTALARAGRLARWLGETGKD
ncbi:potassium/proton antiporter [Glycomyces sp. TRM65418]|uniref:potassium/proton antiporter n=1 Tax=Glycomyces sp. TRM65418 TaxID=2867006 RepID=UPI001CE6ACDF|nr:potassium/proton antiporter [Glycomyces sp. TRM65418]MCC3761698.1 potassium/proton antiporter [Glycomyces sp. TRM65418]QZD55789.1 potassium/proton antiporter [Glycomyces sp. TRM65418]